MRKGWIALLLVALVTPARAATLVLVEGDITIGNPLGAIGGGASEIIADCDPDADGQGIDGITFEVPEAARGRVATLTSSGPGAIDVDVYWYDANCRPDFEASFTRRGPGNESGPIPSDTVVGVVDLIVGANAHVRVAAAI